MPKILVSGWISQTWVKGEKISKTEEIKAVLKEINFSTSK
jgi:hypothetical protein